MYSFKEIFLTLQGEGGQTGRVCVFARFSGCNLWSGRESDRATAACNFCDTDFVGTDGQGGGKFQSTQAVVEAIDALWGNRPIEAKSIVFTGGEPLLQLDQDLVQAIKSAHYYIAVETNGTLLAPEGIDWICVSPKAGVGIIQKQGSELKVVFPQKDQDLDDYLMWDFTNFYLQPMDGQNQSKNIQDCIDYCLAHPKWRLSLQTHKMIGID